MKLKLFSAILISFFFVSAFSQQIQNGDFENWSIDTLYEEPVGFGTTNLQSYFSTGFGNVTKSTDSQNGNYAAHLLSMPGDSGALTGGIFIGNPGPGGINGGTPYSEKPLALQGYMKYNILPNDTATIMIFLKRNGNLMAAAAFNPTGTQLSYTQFTLPFFWFDTTSTNFPDTLVAVVACSSFDNPVAGSELFIDNLTFMGATQPFPNGDFENWTNVSFENPDNWASLNLWGFMSGNISATKTTDHFGAGNYALQLETIAIPNGSGSADTMGFITNGRFGNNGPEGGMAVNNYPKRISGYYKYIPVGPDTALGGMFLYGNNIVLDSSFIQLVPTSTYTYFEMNLVYQGPQLADTLNISFASSNMMDSTNYVGAGSILFLDQLQIEYFPLSVEENIPAVSSTEIYPNPATDYIYFTNNQLKGKSHFVITDIKGSVVLSCDVQNNAYFNISAFENGIYIYKLISDNKTETSRFVICK